MPTDRKPSPRPARKGSAAKAAPAALPPNEPEGLADVPPPLAFERTAATAGDEGFDAATAAVFAAVVAVDVFCVAEANAKGPGRGLEPLVRVADLAERALQADGGGDAEFTHLFAPRLPFDVLLRDGERVTAADLFLARYGAELPKEAVRAVKALVRAEDTVARATFEGKQATIEDLATGRALPGPARWARGSRPFVCRLVRVGKVHVPLAVERVEGRVSVETLLEEVRTASLVARDVLAAGGIRIRSTKKGFGLGARLLAVPDEEEAEA
jgi:hypothetical protein